jgi:CelD/BcsL family acetyltransferase involved in cellulose biosynthesis
MAITIDVDCGEECFDLPHWRELLQRDPAHHVFSTPEWNKVWWEEFGAGKDLQILTFKRDGEVMALVPLYRKHEDDRKILRFVGGIDLTDYLGPICAPDDRWDVADALVNWLVDTDVEWDEFDAHNMPVPLGFAEFLTERADAKGLGFELDQEETSAILALPDSWDEYLASLKSKERHELRRKLRRIGRDHPDFKIRRADASSLDVDFKVFVEMHRGAEGHKGHFMRPEIATFFDRVARAFSELGWLRLDFLEIGERAVASTFSFEVEGTMYLYNSAYEPEAARLSPGLVLVAHLVEEAIEKGSSRFDFLRGPERYKYQLGSEAVPLNNVRIQRKMAS